MLLGSLVKGQVAERINYNRGEKMKKLKDFEEMKQDLNKMGISGIYHKAIKRFILQAMEDKAIEEPKRGWKYLQRLKKPARYDAMDRIYKYDLYKQMLKDNELIEAYLLGEPLTSAAEVEIVNGAETLTYKFSIDKKERL